MRIIALAIAIFLPIQTVFSDEVTFDYNSCNTETEAFLLKQETEIKAFFKKQADELDIFLETQEELENGVEPDDWFLEYLYIRMDIELNALLQKQAADFEAFFERQEALTETLTETFVCIYSQPAHAAMDCC